MVEKYLINKIYIMLFLKIKFSIYLLILVILKNDVFILSFIYRFIHNKFYVINYN
jgi:hypothetical protein